MLPINLLIYFEPFISRLYNIHVMTIRVLLVENNEGTYENIQ